MRELALFAGAGGGILGGLLLGWRTVCAVEIDPYCRSVLLARQRDGYLEPFPIWDDVRTFDGKPWRGHVDVISGGFPCQDISSAGTRTGITGERSGLWSEFARIIGEVRPRHAFVENSPMLTVSGLGVVLGDLASLGFDARWGVLGADDVGAPHKRERIWIVATDADVRRERGLTEHAEMAGTQGSQRTAGNTNGERERRTQHQPPERAGYASDAHHTDTKGLRWGSRDGAARLSHGPAAPAGEPGSGWWERHRFTGVADGLSHRMDRVRATGNGQVPSVARLAWDLLCPGEL